jgi:alpha-galactosidase
MIGVLLMGQSVAAKVKGPVKVFILAGQSNMVGKGFPEPIAWQVTQEKYRERYTQFIKDGDYEAFAKRVAETTDPDLPWHRRQNHTYLWSTRADVWVSYRDKWGDLTVGYGGGDDTFGPEYNFGHVLGDHYDEQVLLIKTAWGGRALARGFLPPSSMPGDEAFARMTADLNKANEAWNSAESARVDAYNRRVVEENKTARTKRPLRTFKPRPIVTVAEYREPYGREYRAMVSEVRTCLASLKDRFPGYEDQGYEIRGFVWFQGWNDQFSNRWLSYEKNMANFIRDVRREFKTRDLPFVVGQMGHDGLRPDKEGSPRDIIKKAQAAVAEYREFKGTVLCVPTDRFWDEDAHAIVTGPGGWRRDVEKWRRFGNDHGYHYYGSPWTFAQIGTAFGEGMVKLLDR